MTKNILIIFTLSILFGCAQESRTPANFKLTLGAIESAGSEFPGGIILSGTNGSDEFKVGLTPSQISSYSIELPSGDWNFRAVGWLGETGTNESPIMTGEARCAYTRATIENEDTVIKMALSSDKCFDGKVASTNAQDTEPPVAGGTYFKRLNLESCLLTSGQTAGSLCDGSALNNMPGESTSARIVFPAFSNFGASVGPLVSGCWNNSGYVSNQIVNGNIPTQVRLPFGGERPLSFRIVGFERKNCVDQATVYRMPDGLNGSQGVSRLFNNEVSQVQINFADNYIGHGDSAFAGTASDLLPQLSCQPDCYPSTSDLPKGENFKDNFKGSLWRYLGNSQGYNLHDIRSTSQAMGSITDTSGEILSIEAPFEYGGLKNGTTFIFSDQTVSVPSVSCTPDSITIQYSTTNGHTFQNIINALASNPCSSEYRVNATNTSAAFINQNNLVLGGGNQEVVLERPEYGLLSRIKRLLVGPIGAGLHKAGLTERSFICDGSHDGDYTFNVDRQNVTVRLGNPSTSATLPKFSGATSTLFERKLTVFTDGIPQEVFYFNCTNSVGVGSYLSDETFDNSHPRKVQALWDRTNPGLESLEVASKRFDSSGVVTEQEWFLFKGGATSGLLYDAWLMQEGIDDQGSQFFTKSVSHVDLTNGFIYVQGKNAQSSSNSDLFVDATKDDKKYVISSDDFSTFSPGNTLEPGSAFPNMNTNPNFMSGYSTLDIENNGLILWDVSY